MHPDNYYANARTELLDLLPGAPRRLLDVGCASGGTARAAKQRWPGLETIGVEIVESVAELARANVDRVICSSAEELDWTAHGVVDVDAVILADVLEHMVDPWSFLKRLRAVLAPGAAIAASIPNVANFWLIEELASGRFEYEDEGLLDATHLRFFTRASIGTLFAQSGFSIHRIDRIFDGRANDLLRNPITGQVFPQWIFGRMKGRRVRIGGMKKDAFDDLRTIQYIVLATPN